MDQYERRKILDEVSNRREIVLSAEEKYPVIMLRGMVVFPNSHVNFDVSRKPSVKALQIAQKNGGKVVLVSQKNPDIEAPNEDDLYRMGTLCTIESISTETENSMRVLVKGEVRKRIDEFVFRRGFVEAYVSDVTETVEDEQLEESCLRIIMRMMMEYVKLMPQMPQEIFLKISDTKNSGDFADNVASNIVARFTDAQELLEELVIDKRLDKLVGILAREIDLLKVENRIMNEVKQQIDNSQREYFLREQLKAIERELGEEDDDYTANPVTEYKEKIAAAKLPEEVEKKALEEVKRMRGMPFGSAEASVIQNYVDWILCLPWNKESQDNINLTKARQILDRDHYGLENVKQRLIEFLAVKAHTGTMKGSIICLVGPPGVGKTSIGKSLARAMKREFIRISLGGVRDEAEIRGHRRTYIGAMPGKIISSLKNAKTSNPLMLLDEIDKLGNDLRGDPAAALLEVLDSEQNSAFTDHYLDMPFDLSKVMFITTANTLDTIPRPLLDRMEVIEIPGYTDEEKLKIAQKHLVPKQREAHGLKASQLKLETRAIKEIIDHYTRESGVRNLEREIAAICRKAVLKLEENKELETVKVNASDIKEYLGPRKFLFDALAKEDQVGMATGLAWTSVGGETLSVEVATMPGNGALSLTGQLGDVMKESASAGMTYIRSRSHQLGIDDSFFKNNDVHIHVPEGAIPKDGPSAGITITTAAVSKLTNTPVKRTVAMTGEITLLGRVLPIGGLKEKLLAARRMGIKTVIIPEENKKDIAELPKPVVDDIDIVPVKCMDEVLKIALVPKKNNSSTHSTNR